jgi:hypothetical protein
MRKETTCHETNDRRKRRGRKGLREREGGERVCVSVRERVREREQDQFSDKRRKIASRIPRCPAFDKATFVRNRGNFCSKIVETFVRKSWKLLFY